MPKSLKPLKMCARCGIETITQEEVHAAYDAEIPTPLQKTVFRWANGGSSPSLCPTCLDKGICEKRGCLEETVTNAYTGKLPRFCSRCCKN